MQSLKLGTVAAVLALVAMGNGEANAQIRSAHNQPSASAFDELYVSHRPVDGYATPNRGGGGCSYRFGVPTSPRYPEIGRPSNRSYEPVHSIPRLEYDARDLNQRGQSRYAPTRRPASDPFYGAPTNQQGGSDYGRFNIDDGYHAPRTRPVPYGSRSNAAPARSTGSPFYGNSDQYRPTGGYAPVNRIPVAPVNSRPNSSRPNSGSPFYQ